MRVQQFKRPSINCIHARSAFAEHNVLILTRCYCCCVHSEIRKDECYVCLVMNEMHDDDIGD